MTPLNTLEDVLNWAIGVSPVPRKWQIPDAPYVSGVPEGDDTETAKFIADCVALRLSFIEFLKTNPPPDAPIEMFYGSDLDTVKENARLRAWFEHCWITEEFANKERYPIEGPGLASFAHDLRDAIDGKLYNNDE